MDYLYSNKEIDIFYPLNENGLLQPRLRSSDYTSGLDKIIIDSFISECKEILGINLMSIFFKGISSHDFYNTYKFVVIVDDSCVVTTKKLITFVRNKLRRAFYNIEFPLKVIKISDLRENRHTQFIVKILSVRVYGWPIEAELEGFRPSKDIVFFCPRWKKNF